MTMTPTRPIDTPVEGELAIQGATLEWIAADAFTVDPSYDRPPNEHRINHLAENWKDEALGVVFASRRNNKNKLYLLDGQHRVGALRKQGRKTDLVPTLVFDGLSVAEEAQLFVLMNKNRRALTPSELFKASLVEGDVGALEIKAVIDELGLKMESYTGGNPHTVSCVATIWRIYRAMGAEGVDAALSLVLITWGEPPPRNAFNQKLLLVLARILYYYENELDLDRLRTTLAKEPPEVLIRRADSISSLQGGDRHHVLADTIVADYNKGLAPTRQLDTAKLRPRKDPFTAATRFRRGIKDEG